MRKKKRLKKWVRCVLIAVLILLAAALAVLYVKYEPKEKPGIEQGNILDVEIKNEENEIEEGGFSILSDVFTYKVIDVGQGLSVLIDYGEMEVLIDAGYYEYGDTVVNELRTSVDGKLDYVIATHSDADHVGGLSKVLDSFDVGKIIYGDLFSSEEALAYFVKAAEKEGCPFENDADTTISLGKNASLTIFDIIDDDRENINNNSIVTLARFGETAFLCTGDLEKEGEVKLKTLVGKTDVVVAGHHGSATANSLLSILQPKYFIVSCGKNNEHGHPHESVLNNALKQTNNVYGTFKSGTITLTSDGITISCDAQKEDRLTEKDAGTQGGSIK